MLLCSYYVIIMFSTDVFYKLAVVWTTSEVYSIQHYVIKLVSNFWQVVFSPCTPVSSTNDTDRHDIAEILFYVALNTVSITLTVYKYIPKRCIACAEYQSQKIALEVAKQFLIYRHPKKIWMSSVVTEAFSRYKMYAGSNCH